MPRGISDFHLPSDLLGIVSATYDHNRSDQNLEAALGPACHSIRKAIQQDAASKQQTAVSSNDGMNTATQASEKSESIDKMCPKCGSPLVKRIAKTGKTKGNEFLGCSSFPKCKYSEQLA